MKEKEDYLASRTCGGSGRTESWAHYFDGQYTKERAVLYTQAAQLAGLSVTNVEEGKVFSGKGTKVSKGFVGVKVYLSKPEDADLYWATFHALEDAQKEL